MVYVGDRRNRRQHSPLKVGYPEEDAQMSQKLSRPDIVRCRAGIAKLLMKAADLAMLDVVLACSKKKTVLRRCGAASSGDSSLTMPQMSWLTLR